VFVGYLLAASALWIGCAPEGAGTIHVEPPQLKNKLMLPRTGVAPTATAEPDLAARPQKTGKSAASKGHIQRNH
jgi:hypothetical protein